MRILILASLIANGMFASVAVREACGEDSAIVTNIQASDQVQVRHAVAGEATPCYSVVVTRGTGQVQGYILDATLPAIQEFERTRALESRAVAPPAPESAAGEKPVSLPPVGPPFETWTGADFKGRHIEISGAGAKVTLVTFWSVQSASARRFVENMQKTGSEFTSKGVRSFGLMESPSAGKANYYLEDMGLDSPQAFDRGLAAKYHADTSKGTTLVVDGSNNVVAVSSSPAEIRAVLARLLSSK